MNRASAAIAGTIAPMTILAVLLLLERLGFKPEDLSSRAAQYAVAAPGLWVSAAVSSICTSAQFVQTWGVCSLGIVTKGVQIESHSTSLQSNHLEYNISNAR